MAQLVSFITSGLLTPFQEVMRNAALAFYHTLAAWGELARSSRWMAAFAQTDRQMPQP
jgi:hypothetical protein